MKFIKKHKYSLLIAVIFLILFVFAFLGLKKLLVPDSDIDKYGDRLKDIVDHPIKNEMIDTIKAAVLESDKANDLSYRLEGKIMSFILDVKPDTDEKSIKALGEKIIQNIEEDIASVYDVHLMVTCTECEEFTPKMASKHRTGKEFVW